MAKARLMKRMMGGAIANAICPPGFLCMDTGFILFVILVLLLLFIGVLIHTQRIDLSPANKNTAVPETQYTVITKTAEAEPNIPAFEHREHQREYNRQKPTAPERDYSGPADVRGFIPPPGVPVIPIQVPTQGLPEQFQQIGVLTAPGGTATSATPNRTLLPLFGRKVAIAKERYNYYTRSDGINPIQVPVKFKNRDCEDDNGCDEITTGDTVGVPLLGQTFVATTYRYTLPRYIPYVA
jgi:hypothetical protein